ncbi:GntR family transcriptional regulator [Caballeronia zhejiangensis]|uniref:GntR family transcriptional regulator n=1 Tax=Caballeronia zhejiangensis TaxID=871203 RepID=UPI0005525E7D|nr:FCD domain-containing protein [Caballeronia zhejiangensis]BBQ03246.1 GntR family transcriptional regulator [Burkholderia sp. SFA1]
MDHSFDTETATGSRTMASVLAQTILNDIVTGAIPPGSKLKMRELAERYGAGMIPLREALSRLAMSGFVEAEDQRGFRVTKISKADLLDITTVRQRIESDALRDAIESCNLAWEGTVLAAFHQVNSIHPYMSDDPAKMNPAWERAHEIFHTTLIAGCRSKWLKQFASTLRVQTARYRHQSIRSAHAPSRDVAKEHEEIVRAVLAHDADRACGLLSEHFARTAQLVLENVDQQTGGATRSKRARERVEA